MAFARGRSAGTQQRDRLEVCLQHWSKSGCNPSSNCQAIHICKRFVSDQCNRTDCKFGHSFGSEHNAPLLVCYGLQVASTDQLKQYVMGARAFRQELQELQVCFHHNQDLSCKNGEAGEGCPFMHLCYRFIKNDSCRFADAACRYSHDLMKPQTKAILSANGFTVSKRTQAAVLTDIRRVIEKQGAPETRAPGQEADSGKQAGQKEEGLPRICSFHNNELSCKKGDAGVGCPYMHVCSRFVKDGSCKFAGSACRYSHSLLKPQVKAILSLNGYKITKKTEEAVLEKLRKKFEMQELSGASSKRPASSKPFETTARSVEGGRSEASAGRGAVKPKRETIQGEEEQTEICTFYLRGKCLFKHKCDLVHCDLPYQWQYRERDKWVPFSPGSNQVIEEAFCDEYKAGVTVQFLDSADSSHVNIDFKEMTYGGCGKGPVRRLSTQSWGRGYKNRPFITKWAWYWLDENRKWNTYDDSCDMEEKFCDGEVGYEFSTGSHDYILNFSDMKQKNKSFGTEREVRRRPSLYTKPVRASSKQGEGLVVKEEGTTAGWMQGANIPDTWGMTDVTGYTDAKTVELDSTSREYLDVKERFDSTMRTHRIRSIKRIQNAELWQEYVAMKHKMLRKKTGSAMTSSPSAASLCRDLNEQLLFHGTKQHLIVPIYSQRGFDFRLAGSSVGTLYGKGNYFARDAKYSSAYTDCKTMFVVRVLVGEYTVGRSEYGRPPPRDPSKPYGVLFDTCVDNVHDPSIFVTFEFGQSYPAYLLQYD